ncbi:hypothetical protein GC105_08100 [Alkalibaculum sp. M08DMB]|uniref:Uncharacterized protein n=1 Tax=Alkalibaculum sporogenes TaxID=2655001 RepID=A0A6A7K8I6_9FIRM|nr:hypothetical protein [Alkalibaculum sporogenes]MPW25750.1 hypothetical protein [Alkalibaculum sporogenes]
MMRKVCAMLFSISLALFVIWIYLDTHTQSGDFLTQYYINNFVVDTWAGNAVASIYLNYRIFDSIFETLMLLISVTAVINLSWRKDNEQ